MHDVLIAANFGVMISFASSFSVASITATSSERADELAKIHYRSVDIKQYLE